MNRPSLLRSALLTPPSLRHVLRLSGLCALLLTAQPTLAAVVRIDSVAATPNNDWTPDTTRFGTPPYQAADSLISHVVNIADCKAIAAVQNGAKVRLGWTWLDKAPLNLTPTYGIKVAAPGTSCDGNTMTPGTGTNECYVQTQDHSFSNPLTASDEQTDIDFKVLLGSYVLDPTGAGCEAGTETDAKIYFVLPTTPTFGGTTSTYLGTSLNVHVDLAPPATPTISSVLAGNNNLRVNFAQADTSDGTVSARVYWSESTFTQDVATSLPNHSGVLTGTSYQITGLENGKTYYVAVSGIDANGNESQGSKISKGVPVITYDLWNKYQTEGGTEEGGFSPCNAQPTGHAGAWGLLAGLSALVLIAFRRRQARPAPARVPQTLKRVLPLLLVAGALTSHNAQAQSASPQTSSLDIRISRYKPSFDKGLSGTPYASVMGDATDFAFGASIDWRIWHGFGEVALGAGVSRWSHEGMALLADGSASNDTTRLTVIPITLDAVYRLDVFAERYEFPLVPYAKAGLVYGLWWMLDGVDNLSRYTKKDGTTVTALGGTGGLYGTIGLRVLLDVFEPGAARSFDIEMGVNHSYLFAEYQAMWANDFGSSKSINLSAGLFNFGLAFDL